MIKTFKAMFTEIMDPIKNFHRMRGTMSKLVILLIPLLCGITCYFIGSYVQIYSGITVYEFLNDMLGDLITVFALFVSFTMGYLSIIITSSSENVNDLKSAFSKTYFDKNGVAYSLYQIFLTEITYTVLVEITVLFFCIIEKFLLNCFTHNVLKLICSIDVIFSVYILILILIDVKNMYFSFWKSK